MVNSMCGIDCNECELKDSCGGCVNTKGHPFGGECVIALCCESKKQSHCGECHDMPCEFKAKLIDEFNALCIKDMPKITDLNALKGSFANIEYTFPNGQVAKLLEDEKIYFGNQVCKNGSDRCYGLAGDESYLLVCEYGINGTDAEIVIYKKR